VGAGDQGGGDQGGVVDAIFSPGGRPGAGNFLLLAQKKVTKEKGTPVSRHLRGAPVLLDKAGACGTCSRYMNEHGERARASDSPRRNPRPCLRLLGGSQGGSRWAECSGRMLW
jgi:hypothetical protein